MDSLVETQNASVPISSKEERKSLVFGWYGQKSGQRTPEIWNSRLSWRIVFAVFLTIMTVQASLMALTLKKYQADKLFELREASRSVLLPLLNSDMPNRLASPLTQGQQNSLVSNTKISGLVIYTADKYELLSMAGEPVATTIFSEADLSKTYLSNDGKSYEVVLRPRDLAGQPYLIVARLNATSVSESVSTYVQQNILIMFLMSAFVTTVLMIVLAKWLLEPILFLRDNLSLALANPETPNISRSPYPTTDEVGKAIDAAQELIKQNAKSLRQIKGAAQSQIHKLAYYDTLTNLPNRTLFVQKLGDYVRNANGNQSNIARMAILTIDLDHFKDVNDSMGHNVGDAILGAVGRRLKTALPETAVVARTGEDEFAITYPLTEGGPTSKEVGERVRGIIIHEPFKVFNESFQIRASIGVSTFPDDAMDPDQVLKNADIALNRAKEDGRDCIREYLEDFDKAVQARFQMLRDLRNAMEGDQLSVFFQPQLDLKTGAIIGAEALIRWFKKDKSKEGGKFISPAEFIPIAEQSGLIVPIGNWVLKNACMQAVEWHKSGHNVRVAVNVSGEQFQQGDLVNQVKLVLQETGITPHLLELEVTESAFMEDIQQTIRTLKDLHALGVELAIDDFGTGYSSLSYLRQFPIDRLKIDQSFIRNALNNADDAAIAKTIIGLGRSLNLKIIAEGVETLEHEQFLMNEGCDEVQGYRYSRPIPAEMLSQFLKTYDGSLSSFNTPA